MKRFSYFLLAAALCGCAAEIEAPEIDAPEGEPELREMTFTATLADDDTVKVKTAVGELADGERPVLWQEYDYISVFSVKNAWSNNPLMLQAGAGTTSGTFIGLADTAPEYYAIYPRNDAATLNYSYETGSKISLHWDGSAQTPTPGSFDPSVALMAGRTTGTAFAFKNLCSYIRLTTDFSCKKIEIYSADTNLGYADIEITFGDDGKPVLSKTTSVQPDTKTGVAIAAPENGTIAPGTYYIALLPTLSGEHVYDIDIKVTSTGGQTLTRTVRFWSSFKDGNILNFGEVTCSKFDDVQGLLGSGTAEDPYRIGNKAQFDLFCTLLDGSSSATYTDKYYRQTTDIDFGGAAVGIKKTFKGSYNGDGHKLTNLTLKKQSVACQEKSGSCVAALFASVDVARIHNLTVEAAGFESNTGADMMIYGGIAGVATSKNTFTNCTFSPYGDASNVNVGEKPVVFGGIVGYNSGHLNCTNCTNNYPISILTGRESSISGAKYAFGGIVGKIHDDSDFDCACNIDRCRNNVSISVTGAPSECYCGGLVGWVDEYSTVDDVTLRIMNCVNKGLVSAGCATRDRNTASGGLVGYLDSDGGDCGDPLLINSINCGSISGGGNTAYVGGLMGYCYDDDTRICACANVGNCTTDKDCADSPQPGALCGTADGEYYYCAYTSGKITYGRYTTDSHIHNAYDIDDHEGQLTAEAMTTLLNSVSSNLRKEATDACGTFAAWTGTWNDQNQFGLDLVF